jgi:predicted nucleic acid-binding protein
MNQPQFVDTNIFLRYLTADPERYSACLALFQQAERNQVTLFTSETIIAEIVYVLSSSKHYDLSRQQIRVALSRLLLLPGLKMNNRNTHLRALALYPQHTALEFEDCLSVAHMEQVGMGQIYSYDREFEQISNVERLEPEIQQNQAGKAVQSDQQIPTSKQHRDE